MSVFDVAAIAFWSAQGLVVFAGAYAGLALLGRSGAWAKITAMAVSYLAWMLVTALVYGRLGDSTALVTGGGPLILALFTTAFASSAAWLLLWLLWPPRQATQITWP